MDRLTSGLLLVVVVVALFAVMWRSWRRRTSRDAAHGLTSVPTSFTATHDVEVQYVATTWAGAPLERLALPGLGFRGFGALTVGAAGVAIAVNGEEPVFIAAGELRFVTTSHVVIDRVVEPGGLVCIAWTLPDGTPCDSYVRFLEPSDQPRALVAISDLIPTDRPRSDIESENNA